MAYRFAGEDEHTFTVHDGKGSFRIGKRALPQALHGKIRGLPKAEGFAEGGEVGAAGSVWEAAKRWYQAAAGQPSQEAGKEVAEQVHKALPETLSARQGVEEHRARLKRLDEATDPRQNMAEGGEVQATDLTAQPPLQEHPPMPGQDFLGKAWADNFVAVRGRVATPADFAPPEQVRPPMPGAAEIAAVPLAQPGPESVHPWTAEHPPPATPQLANSPNPSTAQAAGASFTGMPNYGGIMGRLFSAEKLQEKGIHEQAGAAAQRSQEETGALDVYTKTMNEHNSLFQQHLSALGKEHDAIVDDIKNSRIDPNHVWASKTNGEKATAILGMILSGIGSGLTGQPNLALQVIEKQIDRDIDAQKMNLGKKESLLSDNLRKTQNAFQAEQLTRMQMTAALEGQMRLAAARAGTPDAMGRADQAIAQARMALVQPMMQMAQFQAVAGMVQGGSGGAGYVKSSALPPMPNEFSLKGVVEARKDANDRRVDLPELGQGAWTYAKTGKDAEEIRQSFASMMNLERQVQRLGQLAKTHGAAGLLVPGSAARAEYDATASSVVTELNKLQDLNRLNENEYKSFGNMIPTEGEWITASGEAKFKALMSRIAGKRASEYTHRLGLDPGIMRRKTETPMGGR